MTLIVSGMHLSEQFGLTVKEIEADGFEISRRVFIEYGSDTSESISKSQGQAVAGFAGCFAAQRPDMLLLLGDRFEMHAAAVAALPFKLPVGHIHGGEVTEGAIDDSLRHSMTKLSHIHFVATDEYGQRVIQLGEEPWRVVVAGAPALDTVRSMKVLSRDELQRRFDIRLQPAPLLVTFHPVTLEYEQTEWQITELLAALEACSQPVVFTLPNADTAHKVIARRIRDFVDAHESAALVASFGAEAYLSMLHHAAAMVGNSSSGIIEAASCGLPVVNIGTRQQGRVRAANVIDAGYRREDIEAAVRQACHPEFRKKLVRAQNPYDRGGASRIILDTLESLVIDERLLRKRFHDFQETKCRQTMFSA